MCGMTWRLVLREWIWPRIKIIAVGVGYVCWTILTHMDDARGKLEKDIENVRYDMEAGFERMDLATDQDHCSRGGVRVLDYPHTYGRCKGEARKRYRKCAV